MRRHAVAATLFAFALLATPAAAHAQRVVVDFDAYRTPVTTEHQATIGRPVRSDGFDFYAASGFQGTNRNVLGSWGADPAADPVGAGNLPSNLGGTAAAMFGTAFGERIDMTVGGQNLFAATYRTFHLYSIDLAHQFSEGYLVGGTLQPFSVTFFGFIQGEAAAISQAFTVGAPAAGMPVLTTHAFDGRWRNLEQVVWFQSSLGSPFGHQFTNIEAQVVPEPGTWVLLGTGLGVLGVAARRRRRTRA